MPLLRLRYERYRRNLSQRALAAKVGMPQPTLCNIERGRLNPTQTELLKLANALLVNPPAALMQEVEVTEPKPVQPVTAAKVSA